MRVVLSLVAAAIIFVPSLPSTNAQKPIPIPNKTHPIPNVTSSFCDNNTDFQLDGTGRPTGG